MSDFRFETEHDQRCESKGCDAIVPAGTEKHLLPGPRIMCEPCKARATDAWLTYKREGAEHNARQREKEQLQRDAFTSEGGALGALYECAQCGEDYLLDRAHFHTHPTTQHLCDTCEHIYWSVNLYQYNLRRAHGQTGIQFRRDQRAKRGLGSELRRAQR